MQPGRLYKFEDSNTVVYGNAQVERRWFLVTGLGYGFRGTPMIQGLHASSIVFADFSALSQGLLADLNHRLPGVTNAGYPLRLNGTEYRLRLGQIQVAKSYLALRLDLESNRLPFKPQLTGTVRLEKEPKLPRTKVVFQGKCARDFGSHTAAATTEAVRSLANESSRAILHLLVTAMEASSNGPVALSGRSREPKREKQA
jgi:hypothetical protein